MITWVNEKKERTACLFGSGFEEKGQVGLTVLGQDKATLALSAGINTRPHSVGRVNEDSVGALYLEDRDVFLGVVADSHWGGVIADAVIHSFIVNFTLRQIEFLYSPADTDIMIAAFRAYVTDRLKYAVRDSLLLLHESLLEPIGDTTVIVALVHNNILLSASIGDSALYLFNEGNSRLVNTRQADYLSELVVCNDSIEYQYADVAPGGLVVLATDGLPECKYNHHTLYLEDLAALLENSSSNTVRNFVEAAFREGGEDNIGIVAYKNEC